MKKIKNENVRKEYKKKLRTLIIGLILITIAFVFKFLGDQEIAKANDNIKDLNSVILSKGEKIDQKAYLNVQSKPYKFAVYEKTVNSYYIVSDNKYMYIVYMSPSDYTKLNTTSIKNTPVRVEGITKATTQDIKKLAIDGYNYGRETSEKLTLADFNNYFGEVYLDLTIEDTPIATIQYSIFALGMLFGNIIFLVGLVEILIFVRGIRKLDATKLEELDSEMAEKEAFYYKRAHLYLTRNYVINFGGTFRIIPYKDILWVYKYEQRTNGIKTAQCLRVLVNTGKTYNIANIDIITKKSRDIFEEIWETIVTKNPKVKIGYTKENIKEMRAKIKEIKKNR